MISSKINISLSSLTQNKNAFTLRSKRKTVRGILFFCVLFLFINFWTSAAYANTQCVDLDPNNMEDFSNFTTSSGEVCIHLKGLSANTIIQVDKVNNFSTNTQLGYDINVSLNSGAVIYDRNVYYEEDVDLSTLFNGSAIEAKLVLSKAQNGSQYNYTFNVINSYEVEHELTIISIAVIAEPKPSTPPPPLEGCHYINGVRMCIDPLSVDPIPAVLEIESVYSFYEQHTTYSSTYNSDEGSFVGVAQYSDVNECNNSNRPPVPPPFRKDNSNIQFDLNSVLRVELMWAGLNALEGMNPAVAGPAAISATHLRLFQNHRTGAIFDVKSDASVWDGEYKFGNFLYGAVLAVHGFPENMAQRYAAAYQAWQNYQKSGEGTAFDAVSQGFVNFLTNSGDTVGDPELISQGYRYAIEVFLRNMSDTRSSSCVDSKTLQEAVENTPPAAGGSDIPNPNDPSAGGTIGWSATCELWQFPNGEGGYYYMYRNCTYNYWMQP